MDSLIKLLSVDAPPGTRLQSAELQFRGLVPIWLAIVLLALPAFSSSSSISANGPGCRRPRASSSRCFASASSASSCSS